jgi:hypothetical protein
MVWNTNLDDPLPYRMPGMNGAFPRELLRQVLWTPKRRLLWFATGSIASSTPTMRTSAFRWVYHHRFFMSNAVASHQCPAWMLVSCISRCLMILCCLLLGSSNCDVCFTA